MCQKLYSVNQHNSDRQNQSASPSPIDKSASPSPIDKSFPNIHWVASLPVGAFQSYLPHTVEGIYPKGGTPCPRQSCNNHRAERRLRSISSTGSGHHDNNHALIKRIMDNTEKIWQASILKTVFEQKYYTHEGYTGTLPYKNHPCRPCR